MERLCKLLLGHLEGLGRPLSAPSWGCHRGSGSNKGFETGFHVGAVDDVNLVGGEGREGEPRESRWGEGAGQKGEHGRG